MNIDIIRRVDIRQLETYNFIIIKIFHKELKERVFL